MTIHKAQGALTFDKHGKISHEASPMTFQKRINDDLNEWKKNQDLVNLKWEVLKRFLSRGTIIHRIMDNPNKRDNPNRTGDIHYSCGPKYQL